MRSRFFVVQFPIPLLILLALGGQAPVLWGSDPDPFQFSVLRQQPDQDVDVQPAH